MPQWLLPNGSVGFWKTNGEFGECRYGEQYHVPSHNVDPLSLIDHEQNPICHWNTMGHPHPESVTTGS